MIQRRAVWMALCGAVGAWALAGCGNSKGPAVEAVPAGASVLALGDSLTSGVGARAGEDWPSLLAQRTGWDVVNGGVSGDTSTQALQRLPDLLQRHQPQLVIVGLGGNDFLRRAAPASTTEALTQIVQAARAAKAQVVLVAIPQPTLLAAAGGAPGDHPLFAELGQTLQVPVLGQLWGPVLGNPQLRADQVHANAQGYAVFAQRLEEALRSGGWLAH